MTSVKSDSSSKSETDEERQDWKSFHRKLYSSLELIAISAAYTITAYYILFLKYKNRHIVTSYKPEQVFFKGSGKNLLNFYIFKI